jgi:hypothetical protein
MDGSSKVGRRTSLRVFIIFAFFILIFLVILNLIFFNRSKSALITQPSTGTLTNPTTGILPQNSIVVNKNINTTNWESYMNANLKLSLQYPTGYQADILSENPVSLVIVSSPDLLKPEAILTPNDLKILIFSFPAPPNSTLGKYIKERKKNRNINDKIIIEEFLTLNGISFFHEVIQDQDPQLWGGEDNYLTINNGKRILIYKKPFDTKKQKEFNEILSTIIFNNQL